ncbi:uncharacterized protein LOC135099762 isoform X1 [Scylla paramamosain]|uniref:uncharacterized protein LOC135099762 isoform X1 n=1 Tax=Scylla paramamosain TaxID=85552 RepID=UPI0030834B19
MSQPAVTHSPSCCKELILLFEEIQPQLERTRHSQALPTHAQVLLSLRLFASGSFQNVIGDTAATTSSPQRPHVEPEPAVQQIAQHILGRIALQEIIQNFYQQ